MKMFLSRFLVPGMALVALSCTGTRVIAQTTPSQATPAQSTPDTGSVTKTPPVAEKPDPLKRRLSDREERDRLKATKIELKGQYKKWLDEDVRWIITDQEAKTFKSLSNDEERDAFIEQFWQRRNPNPDSNDNEYRDEFYARIAYANEHFAAGQPGWMTDRGHIYIAYGKPDSIDSHPSGGSYERPMDEGGGETSTFPFEVARKSSRSANLTGGGANSLANVSSRSNSLLCCEDDMGPLPSCSRPPPAKRSAFLACPISSYCVNPAPGVCFSASFSERSMVA